MSDEERLKDEQLAAFTDALLEEGEPCSMDAERPPLASTVEVLARALKPAPVPDRLRRQVGQRVAAQWKRQRQARRLPLPRLVGGRTQRWAWAAVAALAVVAIATAVLLPNGTMPTAGTATGVGIGIAVAVVAVVLAGILITVWLRSRR
jgi:hypothetical protein